MSADPADPTPHRRRRVPAGPARPENGQADGLGAAADAPLRMSMAAPVAWHRAAIQPGRVDARAVALADGGALAWGDDDTTSLFRPTGDRGVWTAGPRLPGPANGAPGLRTSDGSIVIVCGGDGRQVWRWVPGAEAFQVMPPLRVPRHGPALVAADPDGVLVIGGLAPDGGPAMAIEGVTPHATFVRGELLRPRPEPLAAVVGEVVVVLGADQGEEQPELWPVFDGPPASGRPAPESRTAAAVIAWKGQVLRAGGVGVADEGEGPLLADVHAYDKESDEWRPAGRLSTPRRWARLVPYGSSRLALLGGIADRPKVVASVECFDGDGWERAGTLSVGRRDHDAVALSDGRVLVVGGRTLGDLVPAFSELSGRP